MSGALAISSLAGAAATVLPGATLTAQAAPVGQGFNVDAADLRFILQQIKIAEEHARTATADNPCGTLLGDGPLQIPDDPQGEQLPWGLRAVDGTCNNLVPGQEGFGAADQLFPRRVEANFRQAESFDPDGPGPATAGAPTSYAQKTGDVFDSRPRVISNLIVDQTKGNPAAVAAAGIDPATAQEDESLSIPNVAPDVGLSAPYNSVFTLFGQFFDHGLDLVGKSGAYVYMPLQPDDPLYVAGSHTNFMVISRSVTEAGPDGQVGTADDYEAANLTTPFVDQNQTYTSHPAHQVFLREYVNNAAGKPVSTGRLVTGADGGMATWQDVKDQARTLLGIELVDTDVLSVPLLATDPYGRFDRGPNGYPQLVTATGLVEGNPSAPVSTEDALRTGHAFLDDIAHHAVPVGDDPTDGPGPAQPLAADTDPGTSDDHDFGTYDDEMLGAHFIAGDGRVNENIGLTAVHHIFHSEHNRLAGDSAEEGTIKHVLETEEADPSVVAQWKLPDGTWNGERIFQAAKFVTEMEYQHLAFEEFARKVQPMVNLFGEGGGGYDTELNPAIKAEFAHAVYRFGHSMLTETVARRNADGTSNDIELLDAFLNPPSFNDNGSLLPEEAAGSIFRGMSRQVGNEIDEFVTGALRSNLLGLPLDLASINMARAREAGVPSLNAARRQFYAESNNSALMPYTSWTDLGFSLKHRESLVNFIAAYGTHPDIEAETTLAGKRDVATAVLYGPEGPDGVLVDNTATTADEEADNPTAAQPTDAGDFLEGTGTWANQPNGVTITGVDDIDLWVGGLAEKQMVFGGLLGSTFNYVFELQMEDLQFGDRFYYLSRTAGLNLLTQLEGNSFAELIQRNTDVQGLPADVFSRPDYVFNVANLGTSGAIVDDTSTEDYDEGDTASEPGMHLHRMPNGTIRYSGPAHVVFNGRDVAAADGSATANDRIWASEGDDTVRGNGGDDWVQGGDGVDNLIGGLGNDILSDLFGDDVIKGGDGHDAISSGQGFGGDLNQGGRGKDFIVGGNDMTESFAGPGDDFVFAGDGEDTVFGDDGDDWIEGGAGPFNLLQGDAGNPFQDDPNGGHDVIDGDGGEQDFDSEGGDDIQLAGPGIQRAEGMLGFDWFAHKGDPQAGNTDMLFTVLDRPAIDALRDRVDLTEGLSGWNKNDVLRGDDRVADDLGVIGDGGIADGHQLTQAGIDRVTGLADLLPSGTTSFNSGNIIIGGAGSDTLEGRGGDDILNGDAWLDVQLQAPDLSTPDDSDTRLVDTMSQLQNDVFAGRINGGDIEIVRSVKTASGVNDIDTAVFSDIRENYDCVIDGTTVTPCPTQLSGETVRVVHAAGSQSDGTDVLTGIEELVFSNTLAPEAPTNITAVAGNASATVSWSAPAVGAVTGFRVRVLDANGSPLAGEPLTEVAGDVLSTEVTGLTNGTTYRFDVQAFNDAGSGPFSVQSLAVTPHAVAPAAPTIQSVVPGNGQARVTWVPGDDGGSAITGFTVRVVDGSDVQVGTVRTLAGTARTVNVGGLTNGETYWVQVSATNAEGTSPVVETAVTPGTVSAAPVIGTATARDRSALVRWSAPAADGGHPVVDYQVRVIQVGSGQVGALRTVNFTADQLLVGGLTNGTPYRFEVRAVNAIGAGPFSERSNAVTPATTPGAPGIGEATARNSAAVVRWSAPRNDGGVRITGYRVRVLNAGGNQVGALRVASPTVRRLVVDGLVNGRLYRFQVAAVNAQGTGALSARSNSVRPASPPRIRRAVAGDRGGARTAVARWLPRPKADDGLRVRGFEVTALRVRPSGRVVAGKVSAIQPRRARSLTMRLRPGRYRFQVRPVTRHGLGRLSRQSNVVRAR